MSDYQRQGNRRLVGLAAAVGACILLTLGCATTSVQSHTNPQAPARDYAKLMVFVKLQDLGLRQEAEHEFQLSLGGRQTVVVPSLDLFAAGQKRSKDASHKVLADAGVDAVLVIVPESHGTDETYIPETTTIVEHKHGGTTSVTTGGYTQEGEHWANYKATLHDRVTHKVVWEASMSSQGLIYAQWEDLVKSMAKRTSERLIEDHIIR